MPGKDAASKLVTACVVMIGDELLSGRTRDANLAYIAAHLNKMGIQVREARVIPDIEDEIARVVNDVRVRHDYVFTTGGLGPTHDDITADSIAKAFGVEIGPHPEAMAILKAHYQETGGDFTEARQRMARIPRGATLIDNPVSKAPGFQIGNVFVMAGIPAIMQVMMDSLTPRLEGGRPMLSRTVRAPVGEGQIAEGLGALQARYPDASIGSYPFFRGKTFGTSIVMRSTEAGLLEEIAGEVSALVRSLGAEPLDGEWESGG